MITCISLPQLPHPPKKFINRAEVLTQEMVNGTCKEQHLNAGLFNTSYHQRTHIRHGVELPSRLGRL